MAVYYNLSNFSTIHYDFVSFAGEVNSQAHGAIGLFLLITIFLIVLFTTKVQFVGSRAFAAASFVGLIASIFLAFLGWLQIYFVVIMMVLVIISLIVLHSENG